MPDEGSTSHPANRRLPIDTDALTDRLKRVITFDESVYDEIAVSEDNLTPLAIVVASTLLAAVGGWLWLIIEFDGLAVGRVILRELVLGSAFTVALWLGWVFLSTLYLRQWHAVEVGFGTLLRPMGYAAAPWALALLVLVPSLSFGLGIVALAAWAAASRAALRATAALDMRTASLATAAGFVPLVLILTLLADQAGMAPGPFVHAANVLEYVDFDLGDLGSLFQ